jgi:teichuronic acid exporter
VSTSSADDSTAGRGGTEASLARAMAWTAAVKWGGQGVSWITTLFVVRLLSPHDYGIVALAGVCLGLVTIFNEFGLGLAVVTHRDLSRHQLAQLNMVALVVGLMAFALAVAAAWPLGAVLAVPELPAIVMVLSVVLLVSALRTVPVGILQRDLRFGRLAVAEAAQTLIGSVGTVALAVNGLGYWALVIGQLLGSAAFTTVAGLSAPAWVARPRVSQIREVLTFSRYLVVGRFAWYVSTQADHAVVGMTLGGAALGVYSMAWSLAALPLEKIGALLSQVTPGFFAASQANRAVLRRLALTLTEGLAIGVVPVATGMALVAPEFVPLALGERWGDVVVPLQILAGLAALRAIQTVLSPIILVTGGARFSMYLGVLDVTVMPLAFYIGTHWGLVGVAVGYAIAFPLIRIPLYVRVFRRTDLSTMVYLRALWPALSAAGLMCGVVIALKLLLPSTWPLALRFLSAVLVGATSYLTLLATAHRSRLITCYRTFRELRGDGATAPAPAGMGPLPQVVVNRTH